MLTTFADVWKAGWLRSAQCLVLGVNQRTHHQHLQIRAVVPILAVEWLLMAANHSKACHTQCSKFSLEHHSAEIFYGKITSNARGIQRLTCVCSAVFSKTSITIQYCSKACNCYHWLQVSASRATTILGVPVMARLEFVSCACELTEVYPDSFWTLLRSQSEKADQLPRHYQPSSHCCGLSKDVAHPPTTRTRTKGTLDVWAIRTAVFPHCPVSISKWFKPARPYA